MTNKNTNIFARDTTSNELKKKGFIVTPSGRDFIVNQKRVNVRGCNIDNGMAQKTGPGWNRLNPKIFDYFVCVAFNGGLNNVRYFIFSREEVEKFPNVVWKNTPELKNIMLEQDDEELDNIVKYSENKWDKIKT